MDSLLLCGKRVGWVLLQTKYYTTQYEELGFSWLTQILQMEDNYITNSHYYLTIKTGTDKNIPRVSLEFVFHHSKKSEAGERERENEARVQLYSYMTGLRCTNEFV